MELLHLPRTLGTESNILLSLTLRDGKFSEKFSENYEGILMKSKDILLLCLYVLVGLCVCVCCFVATMKSMDVKHCSVRYESRGRQLSRCFFSVVQDAFLPLCYMITTRLLDIQYFSSDTRPLLTIIRQFIDLPLCYKVFILIYAANTLIFLSFSFARGIYCTSVRPGRGIPHMWLSLRFLHSFHLLKGF